MPTHVDRRTLLAALAAAPAGAIPFTLRARAQQAGLIAGTVCLVQPETTAGPFYVDPGLVRRDIAEGRSGTPLRLRLQIVTTDCAPIAAARIDVWHCDAAGDYSGVRSPFADTTGGTFLRGTQFAAADGVATFDTIYPGWYRGRTPHVHYRVFLGERTVLTSQLFFPDSVSTQIYGADAYAPRGAADTTNTTDGIARRAGEAAIAEITGTTGQLDAALVVGLRA